MTNEKIRLEHEAARLFMRLYQRQYQRPMRHIWHNEPAKPDVSCYLEGERLDLEIAHLYGSEAEAMAILGRSLGPNTRSALTALQQTEPASRMLAALERIIWQKAQKYYLSQRVWLVIRNTHPIWHAEDLTLWWAARPLPASLPFEQIWLLPDFRGELPLLQLYPRAAKP